MMDDLVEMWARKALADLERRAESIKLRSLIAEMKHAQDELAPHIERAIARRKANERQEGPNGFVMVHRKT